MRMRNIRNYRQIKTRPITSQRKLLLDIIREAGKHLDAKELYRLAIERDSNISLATVYRNLRFFKEQGLIDENHIGRVRCYYEMKHEREHLHLVCSKCGQFMDFSSPLIRNLVEEVQQRNKFSVTRVELYLEGYCSKCKGRINDFSRILLLLKRETSLDSG